MKAYYNESGKLTQINIERATWAFNAERNTFAVTSVAATKQGESFTIRNIGKIYRSVEDFQAGRRYVEDTVGPETSELFFLTSEHCLLTLAKCIDKESIIIDQSGTITAWKWREHVYEYDYNEGRLLCADLNGCKLFKDIANARMCLDFTVEDEDGEREVQSIFSQLTFTAEQEQAIKELEAAITACKESGLVFGWQPDAEEIGVMRKEIDCEYRTDVDDARQIDVSALVSNVEIGRRILCPERWESEDNVYVIERKG